MNTNRCGNCGFLNFASVSACKRCKGALDAPAEVGESQFFGGYAAEWQGGYQTAPDFPQPAYASPYFPTPLAPLPRTSKNGGTNAALMTLLGIAVLIAVGIGVLWKFGTPGSANFSWQEYKAEDGSFSVQMPTKPIETEHSQSTPAGPMQMHIMMGDMKAQGAYVIAHMEYPPNSQSVSPDMLLDFAVQRAVSNAGATLVSKREITLDGYQGIEVEMTVPPEKAPGGGRAVCQIYLAAPRIYMLFVGGPESSEVYKNRAKFLNSFKLRSKLR